ncbi:hypothetical protein CRV08_07500 [Halarcobacter ebronensis]|uniref:Uncharacterized protein n=1 Tax=Halarcobacter ebronensis TaxID=1462615 RepID=A0A4Q0YDU8_9BACT|nr:hypothetical protein [Halarcobacter ebronensis]RXJ68657.1 hypothetical protein CRV08_07500 [Halarcobacter ebronensis]
MKNISMILILMILALNLDAIDQKLYLKYITQTEVNYSGSNDPLTYTTVKPGAMWVSEHTKKNSTDYVVKEFKNNSWITVKTINIYNHNKPGVPVINKGVNNE